MSVCQAHRWKMAANRLLAQRLWQVDGSGVSQDDNASFVSEVSLKIQKLKKFHSLADGTSWRLVFFPDGMSSLAAAARL